MAGAPMVAVADAAAAAGQAHDHRREQADAQKGTDLVEVLRTYLFNNGSVQKTAAQLLVRRNTVNYRINRAAEILGMDLGNLEARLQLMLCFLLLNMR